MTTHEMTKKSVARRVLAAPTLSVTIAFGAFSHPAGALAHHSFAMFDANQTLTTVGTVKEFQWGSPHTWIELAVLNPDKTAWPLSLECTTISGLMRNGWKPGTLKPGDRVTVVYHPMRDGTPAGQLVQVVTEDGRTLKGQ
jgi:hypothetical protein